MHSNPPLSRHNSTGSALLLILLILGVAVAFLVTSLKSNPQIERDKITVDALAKAKDALIGYAATYRDNPSHAGEVFGYLPCPATDGNGVAAANCGTTDVTQIGLLPWKTLGLPPLRDSAGECLWYAVSGRFKNSPKTSFLNWDTAGQLIIIESGGATMASGVAAAIFSPQNVIGSQSRTPSGTTECGGNTTVSAYLDGSDPIYVGTTPVAGANTTLTVASIAGSSNNDRGLWITTDEIFIRIKQRNDFKLPSLPASPNGDVNNLIASVAACLNAQTTLPAPVTINFSTMAETGGVTAGSIVSGRVPQNYVNTFCSNAGTGIPAWSTAWNIWWVSGITQTGKNFNDNWQDNLLYAKCSSGQCLTINGSPCEAVLMFSGEKDATTAPAQNRSTAASKNIGANYLEGNFLSLFNGGSPTSFTSAPTSFSIVNVNTAATADVAACINVSATPPSSTQVTFASNLSSFVTAGSGVSASIPTQSVVVTTASGSSGGCLWYPTAIPLNGKTLRAYYTFTFTNADPIGGVDLGNGFTLSFLRGDVGSPTTCGTESAMGVLGVSDLWGSLSFSVETDIRETAADNDPAGNHTAIMANGNVNAVCNGTTQGCLYLPANTFEESPTPLNHNQRIEIHTGCNNTCTTCNSGGAYAQINAWTDCASCSDTATDFVASTPKASRCTALDAALGSIYFGFTGGFSSGGGGQGVTLRNLDLRTQ
jgi:hypothetical protein